MNVYGDSMQPIIGAGEAVFADNGDEIAPSSRGRGPQPHI